MRSKTRKRRPFRRHELRLRQITLRLSRSLLFRISQATTELECSRAEFIRRSIVERLERESATRRFEFPRSGSEP
jgi:hypothetical protein